MNLHPWNTHQNGYMHGILVIQARNHKVQLHNYAHFTMATNVSNWRWYLKLQTSCDAEVTSNIDLNISRCLVD